MTKTCCCLECWCLLLNGPHACFSSSVSTHLIFGVVVQAFSSVVFSRVFGCVTGVFYYLRFLLQCYPNDDAKNVRDMPCDYIRKECQQFLFTYIQWILNGEFFFAFLLMVSFLYNLITLFYISNQTVLLNCCYMNDFSYSSCNIEIEIVMAWGPRVP